MGATSPNMCNILEKLRLLHHHILVTKRGTLKNYAAIDLGAAPRSISDEFSEVPLLIIELNSN